MAAFLKGEHEVLGQAHARARDDDNDGQCKAALTDEVEREHDEEHEGERDGDRIDRDVHHVLVPRTLERPHRSRRGDRERADVAHDMEGAHGAARVLGAPRPIHVGNRRSAQDLEQQRITDHVPAAYGAHAQGAQDAYEQQQNRYGQHTQGLDGRERPIGETRSYDGGSRECHEDERRHKGEYGICLGGVFDHLVRFFTMRGAHALP